MDADGGQAKAPLSNAPSGFRPASAPAESRPVATPDRQIHLVGNAHLDPVWLWPWQEGYQEARATFWSVIHRMDEYDDFVFTCDQMVLLSWVEESDPVLFERIRERVAEGRWINEGGWWVEPDCNMPTGESFARQGLYGQRYLKSRFNKVATVGMNVDPFGHNVMLPQILKLQGLDSYCFLRPGPHESELSKTAFWWESPDGSRVLGYRIPFEYQSSGGDVGYQTEKSLAQLDRTLGEVMVFYGVGNHGGGPTKDNIESIYRLDRMGSFGRVKMSSPRTYFNELTARLGSSGLEALPVWTDDLQHHAPGCYSAHSGIKQWQRKAQAVLLSAERWAAAVSIADGVDYPRDELGHAWKQVLFNQFHDILPGSAIEASYDDARDQLGEAIAIGKRIITHAQNVIARGIDISFDEQTQPVVVFNPHSWPVTADVEMQYGGYSGGVTVEDADGVQVPSQQAQSMSTTAESGRGAVVFQAELPAFGYRLYRLRDNGAGSRRQLAPTPIGEIVASETVLENAILRAEFDPATGWLSSLLDKRTGADLVAGAQGEHTQICEDPTDTWGHRVVSYNWPGAAMTTDRVYLRESGPMRASVRVERSWGRSTMSEEFLLGHDSDQLEVRVTIDWREKAHLLKLRFPVALDSPVGTYEIPYGTIERPVDGAEEPGQSWVDLSGTAKDGSAGTAGLAVVNNAKHGYDVSPVQARGDATVSPSIGITAVRSPVYSWHDPQLLEADGVYSFQDQGVQNFSYLLVPHSGQWRDLNLTRRAAELGSRPRAMQESFHDGELPTSLSYAGDGKGSVMITAIKGSEDAADDGTADLVVRAVETTGTPNRARLELPLLGRTIEADFGASQIRTWRVPRDPEQPLVEVNLVEWPLDE